MIHLKKIIFIFLLILSYSSRASSEILQKKIDYYVSQAKFDSAKLFIKTNLNDANQKENTTLLNYQLVKVLFIRSDYNEALKQAFNALDNIDNEKETFNLNN